MKTSSFKTKNCIQCNTQFKYYFSNQAVCSHECRFLNYENKKSEEDCWEWLGPIGTGGYGVLFLSENNVNGKRMATSAHRYSYKKYKGEIPKNLCVMHTCDNPKCTNPKHLILGTWADNNKDRSLKGRSGSRIYTQEEKEIYSKRYTGEGNPANKITEIQAKEIKYDRTLGCVKASKKYNVSPSLIKRIRSGKAWSHI